MGTAFLTHSRPRASIIDVNLFAVLRILLHSTLVRLPKTAAVDGLEERRSPFRFFQSPRRPDILSRTSTDFSSFWRKRKTRKKKRREDDASFSGNGLRFDL